MFHIVPAHCDHAPGLFAFHLLLIVWLHIMSMPLDRRAVSFRVGGVVSYPNIQTTLPPKRVLMPYYCWILLQKHPIFG